MEVTGSHRRGTPLLDSLCVLFLVFVIRRTLSSGHVRLTDYSLADSDVGTSTAHSRFLFCLSVIPFAEVFDQEHVRLADHSLADVGTQNAYSRFLFGLSLISVAETFDSGHVRLADQIQKVSDVRTPIIR